MLKHMLQNLNQITKSLNNWILLVFVFLKITLTRQRFEKTVSVKKQYRSVVLIHFSKTLNRFI